MSDRAVRYDGAQGARRISITLEGTTGSTITNLRPGLLERRIDDAVNGLSSDETNIALAELSDHAVQYDLTAAATRPTSSRFSAADPSTPVVIKNVDAGVDRTDAVNVAHSIAG